MKSLIFLLSLMLSFKSYSQQKNSPKLIVGVVVDQMCYDYLYRFYDKFTDKGFKMIMKEGANCRNTNYNYIPTYTGPGHASIYTGTTPSNHGIVGNDWYDRSTGRGVNCVSDSTAKTVGSNSSYGEFSPINLKTNTITDQLKQTYPKAKVISMSIKNRGAILPGGHLSDGSYWYDFETGAFVTSTFFKSELPEWVSTFNKEDQVTRYMKQKWNTLYDIETYTESGADDSPYERLLPGKETPTFPYDLKEMSKDGKGPSYFPYTPFANTFLADFAIRSIDYEGLGKDNQTDMLCISFSTPDMIGHAFGPQSVEIQDTYLRLDKDIEHLISELNKKVGEGEYTMFITADHAVVPVPQLLIDKKLPGGYVFLDKLMEALRGDVTQEFGVDLIVKEQNLNIYLDHVKIDSLNVLVKDVAQFVAQKVKKWNNVKRVYTANRIENGGKDDEWLDMIRLGYHHSESGDVLIMLEPGYLDKSRETATSRKGTSHGSAFSYDTQVPLLWYGKQISPTEIIRRINITDITATLSHFLYIQNPSTMTGEPILELFK